MSEQDRSRLYDWWCEHADEALAEYAMSCLSPVPLPDLATKDDFARFEAATKDDFARLEASTKEDFARLEAATKDDFARLEAATKEDFARLEASTKDDVRAVKDDLRAVKSDVVRVDAKVDALAVRMDALAVRMDEKFDRVFELREIDRRESRRRDWKIALALPVEVVLLFAGVAAVLEWLRG